MKNVAVILAGGKGERFKSALPKQFVKIGGRRVIEYTIDCFDRHSMIDEIAIVMNTDYIGLMEEICAGNTWDKVTKILEGGKERYHSSLAAIKAYEEEENINLIFHDAVRPFVDERIVTDTINALKNYNAVDVAIPASDTIIQVHLDDSTIDQIPDRSRIYQGQTPQAFKLSVIKEAYELALIDPNFKTTDDCGTVRRYLTEEKIYVVQGSVKNMKLTQFEDLFLLTSIFEQSNLMN